MNDLQLFDGISAENRAAMMSCFKPEQRSFRRGETIRVYAPELEQLCLLASGRAHLYCMDSDGEYTLLEQYRAGDIFGEIFSMPYADLGYAVGNAIDEVKAVARRVTVSNAEHAIARIIAELPTITAAPCHCE